jgi:hypothetical protein
MTFDGKVLGQEVVDAAKGYIDKQIVPLLARLDAIDARLAQPVEKIDLAPIERDIAGIFLAFSEMPDAEELVARAIADLPVARDGVDGINGRDGSDGKDGVDGTNGKDGADGVNGKDGLDVMQLMIDAGGSLVGIMSNGTTKAIGQVNGKDGAPGVAGKDGADGIGFDDLDVVETDDGIFLHFRKGDAVKLFRLAIPRDRGFFKDGSYGRGDGVTYGGSYWFAQVDQPAGKPEIGNKDWRLAVKRARDGKDGK